MGSQYEQFHYGICAIVDHPDGITRGDLLLCRDNGGGVLRLANEREIKPNESVSTRLILFWPAGIVADRTFKEWYGPDILIPLAEGEAEPNAIRPEGLTGDKPRLRFVR